MAMPWEMDWSGQAPEEETPPWEQQWEPELPPWEQDFSAQDLDAPRQAVPVERNEMRAVEPSTFEQYIADPARRGAARLKQAITTATRDEDQPERYAVSMARLEREREAFPMTEEQEAGLQAIAESDELGEFVGHVIDNPGAIANVIVESLSTFAPALVGTAIAGTAGGPLATAGAAGVGSGVTEALISMTEAIGEAGGDPSDPAAWLRAIRDKEVVEEARKKGVIRGVSIGAFDAATAGIAGRLLAGAKPGLTSAINRSLGELGIQMFGGGAGEATAQVASGEEFKLGEVGLEAIAEGPTAAVEVPINIRQAREAAARNTAEAAQQLRGDEAQLLFSMEQMQQNPDDPDLIQAFNTEMDYFVARYGEDAYRDVLRRDSQQKLAGELADTQAAEFAAMQPDEMAARQQQLPGMEEQAGPVPVETAETAAARTALPQFGPSPQQQLGLPTPRAMEREELAAEEAQMRQETDAIAAQREAEEAQLAAEEAEYARIQRDEDARRRMQEVAPEAAQLGLPLDIDAAEGYRTMRALEGEPPTAEPQLVPEEEVSRVTRAPQVEIPESATEVRQLSVASQLERMSKSLEGGAIVPLTLREFTYSPSYTAMQKARNDIHGQFARGEINEGQRRKALNRHRAEEVDRGEGITITANGEFYLGGRPVFEETREGQPVERGKRAGRGGEFFHPGTVSAKGFTGILVRRGRDGGYGFSEQADTEQQLTKIEERQANLLRAFNRGTVNETQLEKGLETLRKQRETILDNQLALLERVRDNMKANLKPGEPMKDIRGNERGVWTQESIDESIRRIDELITGKAEEATVTQRSPWPNREMYDTIPADAAQQVQPDMFQAELDEEIRTATETRQRLLGMLEPRRRPGERTTELPETPVPRAAVTGERVTTTTPRRSEPSQGGGIGVSEALKRRMAEQPGAEERGYLRPGEQPLFGPVGTKERTTPFDEEAEIGARGEQRIAPKRVETQDTQAEKRKGQKAEDIKKGKERLAKEKKEAERGRLIPTREQRLPSGELRVIPGELDKLERNVRARAPKTWSEARIQQEIDTRAQQIIARRREATGRKKGTTPGTKGEAMKRYKARKALEKKQRAVETAKNNILAITPRMKQPKAAELALEMGEALAAANLPGAQKARNVGKALRQGKIDVQTAEDRLMNIYTPLREELRKAEAEMADIAYEAALPKGVKTPEAYRKMFLRKETARRVKEQQDALLKNLTDDQRRILETGGERNRGADRAEVARGQRRILSFATPPDAARSLNTVKRRYGTRLNLEQTQGVAWALDALNRRTTRTRPATFMLGDGTGFGKTRQILATADSLIRQHGGKVLVVHPGAQDGPLVAQARNDAEALGVPLDDRIEFVSYQTLQRSPDRYSDEYTAVMFDEAHNAGNEETSYADVAGNLNTSRRLFASATTGDTGYNLGIFAQLNNMTLDDYLVKLGYKRAPGRKKAIQLEPQDGTTFDEIAVRIARDFKDLANKGKIVSRRYEQIADKEVVDVEPTGSMVRYAEAIGNMDEISAPERVNQQAVIAESDKADAAVAEIEQALAKGHKVVLMANRHSDIKVGPKGNQQTIPSVINQVADKLREKGINFLEYHNGVRTNTLDSWLADDPDPRRIREQTNVLLTTFSKGGTGLNLDDSVGHRPRTMIVTQIPYSGTALTQAIGRIDRQTTRSQPTVSMLHSEQHPGDRHAMQKQAEKQKILNAVSTGVPFAEDWTVQNADGYVVEQLESDSGVPEVKVRLDLPEDAMRTAAEVIKQAGGWYSRGSRTWTMRSAAWEEVQPYVDTLAEEEMSMRMQAQLDEEADLPSVAMQRVAYNEQVRAEDVPAINVIKKALRGGETANLTDLLNDVYAILPDGHRFKPIVSLLASLQLQVPVAATTEAGQASSYQVDAQLGRKIITDPESLTSLLHEGTHAGSEMALRDKNDPRVRRLNALFEQAKERIEAKYGTGALGQENYGVTNLDEFLAEALSNPVFQTELNQIQAGNETLWQKFLGAIKSLLGMQRVKNSVLDEVLRLAPQVLQNEQDIQVDALFDGTPHITAARTLNLPVLNRLGEDIAQGTGPVANAVNSARPFADGMVRRFREMVKLPVMTMRQIAESYQTMFQIRDGTNPLVRFMDLLSKKERASRNHQRTADFELRKWTNLKNIDGDMEQKMSVLMGESTLAGVHPHVPFDHPLNKHLREKNNKMLPQRVIDANRKQHAKLASEHKALSADAKQIYNDVRTYYENDWNTTTKFIAENIARVADLPFVNLTAEDILSSKKGDLAPKITRDLEAYLDKNLQSMGNTPTERSKAKAELTRNTRQFIEDATELRSKARLEGPYFPLRRFGDYAVEALGPQRSQLFADWKAAHEHKQVLLANDPGLQVEMQKNEDGSYTVNWRNRVVEFHETAQAAQRASDALQTSGNYETVTRPTAKEEYSAESMGLSGSLVDRLARSAENERVAANIRQAFVQLMPETSIHKAELQRAGVQGFSTDMRRAFAAHGKTSSHYLSQLEFGTQLAEAMTDMKEAVKRARELGDENQIAMQNVVNELSKRDKLDVTEMDPNVAIDGASNIGFIWYLLSPSYWFVNSTQPHMIATPWLGARFGTGKASGAMTRAYGAITPEIISRTGAVSKALLRGDTKALQGISDFLTKEGSMGEGFIERINKTNRYSPERKKQIIAMLNNLGETGIIDMTFAADLRTTAEGGGAIVKGLNTMTEWARIMPHLVEVMNRTVTATAAYDLARNQGQSHAQATKFAEQAVASTQFDYGAANKPRYFNERQFKLARPVLMFMQHSQHMYYMMLRSIAQAYPAVGKRIRGERLTADERAEVAAAAKTFAGITASHALMAGAVGATFEPIKWAIGLAMWAFGGDDEPFDYELAVREFMVDTFGKEVGTALAKGIPYAFGADMSGRIALNNLLFFDNGNSAEGREWLESKVFELFGPLGGMAANGAEAVKNIREGDYWRAAEQMTPKMFRDMIRTANLGINGMVDGRGKTIRPAADTSPLDLFLQASGLAPSSVSQVYAKQQAVKGKERYWERRRQRLMEKYTRAKTPAAKRKVWAEIREFNRGVPARSMLITRAKLLKSRKETRRIEREIQRRGGVYIQKGREEFLEYGERI